jgi:DNA-binding GntR family transcriptional regulator
MPLPDRIAPSVLRYGHAVSIDYQSADPPYRQLAAILRGQIERGELTGTVPSITALIQTYGVAKNTVRKAISVLAEAGLVRVEPGWGTFVTEAPRTPPPG